MSHSYPSFGFIVTPNWPLLSCGVIKEQSYFGIVFRAMTWFMQMETGQSSLLGPGFFVCLPLSCEKRKVWIDLYSEGRLELRGNIQSLTISCSCFSTAIQEEAQTKKRSSERAACDVPAIVSPPPSILSQPLAPQAFSSQLSPSSRNYWWWIWWKTNTSLCWGPNQFTHPWAWGDTQPVPSTQTTFWSNWPTSRT